MSKTSMTRLQRPGAFDIPLASGSHGRYRDAGTTWGAKNDLQLLKLSHNVKKDGLARPFFCLKISGQPSNILTAHRVHYIFDIES